jgi:hypothetical protein
VACGKIVKLNDEKKYIVNKDLYTNPFITRENPSEIIKVAVPKKSDSEERKSFSD